MRFNVGKGLVNRVVGTNQEIGAEYRHNDLLDPLWNMLDLTPEGRGDFHPQLRYGAHDPARGSD